MGRVTEDPVHKPLQAPVFLDPTGIRWFWFRLFAVAAIAICAFGFVSVIVGSSHSPKLPTLDLPFVQKQYASETQPKVVAKDDASNSNEVATLSISPLSPAVENN